MAKTIKPFPLAGRWAAKDQWETEIAFTIAKRGRAIKVKAIDQSDGEEAEIYGVKIARDGLYFGAHWSSGRFTKYRLRLMGHDELEVVFTHTATTQFGRQTVRRRKNQR